MKTINCTVVRGRRDNLPVLIDGAGKICFSTSGEDIKIGQDWEAEVVVDRGRSLSVRLIKLLPTALERVRATKQANRARWQADMQAAAEVLASRVHMAPVEIDVDPNAGASASASVVDDQIQLTVTVWADRVSADITDRRSTANLRALYGEGVAWFDSTPVTLPLPDPLIAAYRAALPTRPLKEDIDDWVELGGDRMMHPADLPDLPYPPDPQSAPPSSIYRRKSGYQFKFEWDGLCETWLVWYRPVKNRRAH